MSEDARYIAEVTLEAIEEHGASRVAQVVWDNCSVNLSAKEIVEAKHPHIIVTGCLDHILNLVFKEIVKIDWAAKQLDQAQSIVTFFNNHRSHLWLCLPPSPLAHSHTMLTRTSTDITSHLHHLACCIFKV